MRRFETLPISGGGFRGRAEDRKTLRFLCFSVFHVWLFCRPLLLAQACVCRFIFVYLDDEGV